MLSKYFQTSLTQKTFFSALSLIILIFLQGQSGIAQTAFNSNNLAIVVASASANNTTASVVEINKTSASQTAVQTIAIPGTGTNAIRVSGSASSTLYASNSNDGSLFCFTGHNVDGNTASNSNTFLPRAVVTVNSSGTVALATTYSGTSGNQTRCATTINNSNWFVGDQGGFYTNTSTAASPSGNIRSVKAFGGTVYAYTASTTAPPVGIISAATGGTFTALSGLSNGNSNKTDFYLVSSTGNSTYDILYTVETSSATAGTISKFSLVNGSWAANGTYTTTFGGFGLAAEKSGTGANLFVTTGNGATISNSVIKLIDAAGYNTTINITTANNVTLYTTVTGTLIKGIAFAPKSAAAPSVSVTGTLSALATTYGTASTASSFSVSGANLTTGIGIKAPAGFELSTSSVFASGVGDSIFVSGTGTITSTTIYVRLKASATVTASPYSGNIVVSSTGATSQNVATISSSVNQKSISISGLTANNKLFDGTTTATLSGIATLVGVETNDLSNVSISGTPDANFSSSSIGNSISVLVTGYTISGSASGNYLLSQPTGLTANITSPSLSNQVITFNAITPSIYGGASFDLTASASSGLAVTYTSSNTSVANVSGSTVTIIGVGTATITASQLGNENYNPAVDVTQVLTVNPKALTVTGAIASNKIYNGNTSALITGATLDGIVGADVVTVSGGGTFASANVANGIAVSASLTLGGANASNYSLTQPSGLSADITALNLTITGITVNNKVFDGNTTATLSGTAALSGVVASDLSNVTLTGTPSATFVSSAIGNGIAVTVSGYSLTGAAVNNYTLSQPVGLTANITSVPTTLTAGDIAIIGYNTSGSPDNFAILVTKTLSSGTTFFINDNELASGATTFTDLGEGEASFTVKSGQSIPAGTVIVLPWGGAAVSATAYDWSSTTGFGLGNNSEELYVYTASSITATTPNAFIYFAKIGTAAGAIPSSLTSGFSAITPSGSSSRYATSGAVYTSCRDSILSNIGRTTVNWNTTGATTIAASDWSFSISANCPLTAQLSVSSNVATEADASIITVSATASGAVTGNQTISVNVSGTGITGTDYTLSNNTITILDGQTSGSVTFSILDDSDIEGTETATLTISNPSTGIVLGNTTSQNVVITDNDFAQVASVNLSVSSNSGSESATTSITVTATSTLAVVGNQTVDVAVTGTNITSGDYTLSNATITIPNGQTSGSVTFVIQNDNTTEGAETATLTISNPSSGIELGSTTSQNIVIVDNALDINLCNYVRIGRYDLPEPTRTTPPANSLLAQEVSGVTYNWDTQTLFVIGDAGTSVVQVSKTGQLINSMTLAQGNSPQGTEFYDPEGITYVGNGKFVFTEERDRNVVQFTYVAGGTLTRANAQTVALGTFVQNIGLEGLSYDPLTGGFIVVKEIQPLGIFQTNIDFNAGTATNGSATTVNSTNLFDPALTNLLDFADVFALSNIPSLSGQSLANNLLVLSHESAKILNISRTGVISSSLTIQSDAGNPLSVAAQQHEGLTMDSEGVLYVVSENGGGDFDHPQLWVYAPSALANQAPTAISLSNKVDSVLENTNTTARLKVADINIADDGLVCNNNITLSGVDTSFFEVIGAELFLKAGTSINYEVKTSYSITINVDDATTGTTPDATLNYTLFVKDILIETPTGVTLTISEVAPWSSGNSPVAADWFELSNTGTSAVNITGWKMDDNSNSFASSVTMGGITTINPGESVIFFESPSALVADSIKNKFLSNWFGNNVPLGLQVGYYTGSGVGLSTGGDAVNVFNASGELQAKVTFGTASAGPKYYTFNNAIGLNNTAITTLSAIGVNDAFAAVNDTIEVGSPGTIGKIFITEVAPWSSGNSPVGADWFELTNTKATAVNIAGWKMDDNSGSFAASVALTGITSIAPGESVIFTESATPDSTKIKFLNTWFGNNPPTGLQVGSYTGTGIGLSTSSDAVNIYNATGVLQASTIFGASPTVTYKTFDNAAKLNNTTISQLSAVGVNGAFIALNNVNEIGSPGSLVSPACQTLTVTATQGLALNCSTPSTTITVSVAGGTAPYTGIGTFTVSAGTYNYTVTDAYGCSGTTSITVSSNIDTARVSITTTSSVTSETTGTVVTVTATASTPVCGNQTVALGVSGAGITAGDYNLSNSTITILDGQTTGSVTFTVVNDNVVEPTETAVLTISNPSLGLVLDGTTTQNISISDFVFTLQILHASDFEAAVDAVTDAPRFAAIVDTLEGTYANTIKLSSGDNYIPGPFLSSGEDPTLAAALKTAYESYYNTTFNSSSVNLLPSIGRADISIMNFIGIEASALGNHEFDLGTTEVRNIIRGANSSSTVRSWFGAQFPYLSANLNFSADGNLSAIATTNRLLQNTAFQSNPSETVSANTNKLKLAPSTIITKGGQKIGIVGATTQVLASISSPGATTVVGGGANDMTILAGILQPVINDLIADGCNKIILLSHLQQIAYEKELAGKLSGVDIIMAGGSNTLMADSNDRLRAGDVAVETYPFLTTDLDGKTIALINTEGNYKYVGRLVVDFDASGTLIPSSINPLISGVYAADDQGVNDAWGANVGNAFAVGTRGYQVQLLSTAIGNVITAKDGNLFGKTSVFIEGRRNIVRTEQTNLGDLSAEANLWMAKFYDSTTVISIKNGGGIRSAIGNVIAVGDNVTLAPPIANPSAGKQSGDISQLDIENSLRFNNQLSLVTLTASGMRSILEHAVAATTASATPGQFAQVAGVRYSYNFSNPAGSRILNAVVTDAGGNNILDTLVLNGTTYGNLSRTFRVVTLSFLAGGGDSYPFSTLITNRVDLNSVPAQGPALASFATAGSEQDAFAEYMKSQYSTTPFGIAETPLAQDCRIQRIPTRTDNVLPPNPGTNGTLVICSGATVTQSQLFAALGGTPATGGTWAPALAGAGVYTYTVSSPSCSGSASSTVTVTANTSSTNTVTESACNSYLWLVNGQTYTTSGTYTWTGTNAAGCDSIVTLILVVNQPTSSSSSIAVCSSVLPYSWNGQSITAAGTYTATLTNAAGCDSTATLVLTISGVLPTTPTAITQTLVSNICGARTYRFSTAPVANATGYNWIIPTSVGGVSGMTVDSGDVNNSRIIVVTFASNAAAGNDSAKVRALTGCGNSAYRVAKLTNTVLGAPAVPSALTITSVQTNVCGARIYRYSAPALPGATATTVAATGYLWSFSGTLGANATIDSGTTSSRTIVVSFISNAASAVGDSVRVLYTSDCGNSVAKAAKLSNTAIVAPAAPSALTITAVQTNVCGARIYRYSAPALPDATATTGAATGYVWSFTGTLGANATIDSGTLSSRTILVSYTSDAAAGNGDSVRVLYTSDCGNSVAKAAKLSNTAIVAPAAPSALTITAVQTNVCGARIYRYSAPALPDATATTGAATGYVWSFTGTLGANATIDSGTLSSRTILVSYTSNTAAGNGDSVRVLYTSDCGNSVAKAAKLSNTAIVAPAAPTAITITNIQANVCGNKKFRYSAPTLPAATATTGVATGYVWSFSGTLGANAVVDSGTLSSRTIVVSYTSNAAAQSGDSVSVFYTSDCGNGAAKAAKLTNTSIALPAAPTAITITPIQVNVCGVRRYRYTGPALPAGTTTASAATGYNWDFVGSLYEYATIDSGDVNSQKLVLTFTSNDAAATGDSVKLSYTSSCGNSLRKASKLSNLKLAVPAAPTAVTIASIQTNVCGARRYRYSAPALPAASTTAGAATGYVWSFTGTLGANATVDSGSLTSRVLTVTFTSNVAAGTGDSVRVLYTSDCGNSLRKTAKLSNTAIVAPAAPTAVTIQTAADVCNARKYRYFAPAVLPAATATAGAATGYLWSLPTGTVGSTGSLDSGSLSGRTIVIVYTSNAAATTDSIRVRYTSGCGNSAIKAQKLSNVIKTGCVPPIAKNISTSRVPNTLPTSMEVKVYPNPTTNQFNVQVKSSGAEEAVVRVLDVTGRFIKSVKVSSNSNVNLGSDLKAGSYMLEVRQGKEVKIIRVMKF